jgi:divalent metal cation (Fe/Co/Zn/Cd) transporter
MRSGEPGSLVGIRSSTPGAGLSAQFDPEATRSGRRISELSIGWTLVTGAVAVAFGIASGSAALAAFGFVGLVDLVGSVALVHHFRHALRTDALSDRFEQRAHRIVTVGLLTVGSLAVVVSAARLATGHVRRTAPSELVIAAASLFGLVVLATRKIAIARAIPSAALRSDGFLSAIGAAQACVVIIGAAAAVFLSWRWADDAAALAIGLVAVTVAVHNRPGRSHD